MQFFILVTIAYMLDSLSWTVITPVKKINKMLFLLGDRVALMTPSNKIKHSQLSVNAGLLVMCQVIMCF